MPIAKETPINTHSRSPIYSPDSPLTRVICCASAEAALSPAVMDEVEITAANVRRPSNHLPDSHSTRPGERAPCQGLLSRLLPSVPHVPVSSRAVLFSLPSPQALMLNRVKNTSLTPGSRQHYPSHTRKHRMLSHKYSPQCFLYQTPPVGLNLI